MNWVYWIPVVSVAGLLIVLPAASAAALAIVVIGCFVALWLSDMMR